MITEKDIMDYEKIEEYGEMAYKYSMLLSNFEEDINKVLEKKPEKAIELLKCMKERIKRDRETLAFMINEDIM